MLTSQPSITFVAGVFICYLITHAISSRTDAFLPAAVLLVLYGENALGYIIPATIIWLLVVELITMSRSKEVGGG